MSEMYVNSRVETLWRRHLAAIVVYSWRSVDDCVQAFGISDMFEDPSPEIC